MKPGAIGWPVVVLLLLRTPAAFAWGHEGHQLIGSIADKSLSHHARAQLAQLLGIDLRTAGLWADCVRSVVRKPDGSFEYAPDPRHPEYAYPCTPFQTPTEIARMEDYVRRNWSNCPAEPGHGCHESYHYTDVAIQRDHYGNFTGTSEHDIVAAIRASIAVLQGHPAPSPFSIRDQKEALLMLTHFIEDLHQPLHAGAVYLDASGQLIDPDLDGDDPKTHTAGGNFIRDRYVNFHFEWDQIPDELGTGADASLIRAAHGIRTTAGPLESWAAVWATESIRLARTAFAGAVFVADGTGHWTVELVNPDEYAKRRAAIQKAQVIKAGARLAQVLNTIWP
jgi:S1/P1 Nuclease